MTRQTRGHAAAGPPVSEAHDVRARLYTFIDPGSLLEFGRMVRARDDAGLRHAPDGDGVVTGMASLCDRPIAIFAQDGRSLGGSLGEAHALKIIQTQKHALRRRCPLIGINDSGGARIQEGVAALDGYGRIFQQNAMASGRVPQISVILGPCAGGAVYSPALTDIVIMVRHQAHMFLTGPTVIRSVTGEDLTAEEIGGTDVHARQSGVAHLVAEDETTAGSLTRRVLSYLPQSCWDPLPAAPSLPAEQMPDIPRDQRKVYDVRTVIRGIIDAGSMLELQQAFAPNIVTAFGRVEGQPVGVVANQPMRLAGVLDGRSGDKTARFVRMCDAFGLPLITLVDTPGFLPGHRQEANGVIRRGAKLLYAFAEATVPRITVILRKAYGGAYIVMNSKPLGADYVFAWPSAQIAVMGAEAAVGIIHRRELSADPSRRDEFVSHYRRHIMAPQRAAERMSIDDIIEPASSRDVISTVLRGLGQVRRGFRHDNLPQ